MGRELVHQVERLIDQRDTAVFLCREILATLSLEGNQSVPIGHEYLREQVKRWTCQLNEAVDEPNKLS